MDAGRARLARPLCQIMMYFLLVIELLSAPAASGLRARVIPNTARVASDLIVGRAVCGDTTWFLTDRPELIALPHAAPNPAIKSVTGFRKDDRPWGLACFADGALWTHATNTVLARVDANATVRERRELQRPGVSLFGWMNRLLLVQLPLAAGQPLFTTTLADGRGARPWPSLIARSGDSRDSRAMLIARNLANCGIARGANLPCWFADDPRAVVSDGVTAHTVSFPALAAPDVDPEAPIWDLAFQNPEAFWLLVNTKTAARAHKAAGRLVSADGRGATVASLQLELPVRTIVFAGEKRTVLLAVDGRLLEVEGR